MNTTNYSDPTPYNKPMETVYIDSLFILNLAIDYLLCLVSGRICGVILRRWRYLGAAAMGALYAVGMYLPGLEILKSPGLKLCLWLGMSLCAFGKEERMLRCAVVFAAVSAAFGGFIWAIELAGAYPAFDMRTLILSFALCYAALRLIFGGRARLMERKRVRIGLELLGRGVEFMALVDTGNSLTDPVSGKRVVIVSPHAIAGLFPGWEEALCAEPVALLELLHRDERLRGRFRLLSFSSLGGSGLLCAFRPDRATMEGKELEIMAAISDKAAGEDFQAII